MALSCVITGGLGFVGRELCRYLLKRPVLKDSKGEERPIGEIVLFDNVEPGDKEKVLFGSCTPSVRFVSGDISRSDVCTDLVNSCKGEYLSIFHLAGIMSGQGEKDFDLCLRVNLDGTRALLEAARHRAPKLAATPRFLFASTGAAFGETDDCPVSDTTKLVPLNTYGMTKVCSELLVTDYTRKGFIDGRSTRLPTVIVRPGLPNAATTSCYSGVIREPLHGVDVELPVGRDLPHAVTNARTLLRNLVTVHDAMWPTGLVDRSVTLPSVSTNLGQLVEALLRVVPADEHERLGKITDKPDPFLSRVVGSMACRHMRHDRALSLGCIEVPDIDTMIREFIEDFGESTKVTRDRCRAEHPSEEPEPKRQRTTKKVALVTGAGSGIGKESALRLARAGFAVVLVGRRLDPLIEVRTAIEAAAGEAVAITADVSKPQDVNALFANLQSRFDRLDLLFNNAGIVAPAKNLEELPLEQWKRVIDVNLTGPFLCTQKAFHIMKKQGYGRVIFNGSVSAQTPRPLACVYNVTKHGLTGLTKSAALEGRSFSIACGQIDVGNAATSMTSRMNKGVTQANGEIKPEATMSVENVAAAVELMASLPYDANILNMTVLATQMPFVGRG